MSLLGYRESHRCFNSRNFSSLTRVFLGEVFIYDT